MIYGQGHLIPQFLSSLVTLWSDLQNLTDFEGNFLLLLPAGTLLEPAVSKVRWHPGKVSKPHPESLFPKHRDKDRSQQGGMRRGNQTSLQWGRGRERTDDLSLPSPLCSLQVRDHPEGATQTLIPFPGPNITNQNSPTALCSLPNVPVPFTFSCLWKCLMWHCKMTGKKFNSIIYYGTLMFYWMKPSARECFPMLWARSRIYSRNRACLRELHSRNATRCITNMWESG